LTIVKFEWFDIAFEVGLTLTDVNFDVDLSDTVYSQAGLKGDNHTKFKRLNVEIRNFPSRYGMLNVSQLPLGFATYAGRSADSSDESTRIQSQFTELPHNSTFQSRAVIYNMYKIMSF
jgi:hypothetical protein